MYFSVSCVEVYAMDVKHGELSYSRCSGHTTPKKCEITALFQRSGLPSTLIRPENPAFQKCSTNYKCVLLL